jgi:exodeoxyribonuclease VII large subunit
MVNIAHRRWPGVELWLYPSLVQGVGAAEQISAGISAFNKAKKVDVIVIGRGGGSLEDLWPFNEEIVARAIYKSAIPVVSAVGHEVDFTIADFVADLRAPTPSAAMELILPDREEVLRQINQLKIRLSGKVLGDIKLFHKHLSSLSQHWALREPVNILRNSAQRVDELNTRLVNNFKLLIEAKKSSIERVQELLTLFRPQAVLARGYAIVHDAQGVIVRDSQKLSAGSQRLFNPPHKKCRKKIAIPYR